MRDRLEICGGLLSEDGSIWVTIDDNEAIICKVLMDEVFGTRATLSPMSLAKAVLPESDAQYISAMLTTTFLSTRRTREAGKLSNCCHGRRADIKLSRTQIMILADHGVNDTPVTRTMMRPTNIP